MRLTARRSQPSRLRRLAVPALLALGGCGGDGSPPHGDANARAVRATAAGTVRCGAADSLYLAGTPLASRERWYGAALRAADERPLCQARGASSEVYRLLWLPPFSPAVVVRAERHGAGFRLVAARLASGGGEGGGRTRVGRDTALALSASDWDSLTALVGRSAFWTSPSQDPSEGVERSDRVMVVRFDGTQWVLEGRRLDEYHVVDRWSPAREGPYGRHRAVGEWLLRRSGLLPLVEIEQE